MKKYELVLLLDRTLGVDERKKLIEDLEKNFASGILVKDEIGVLNLKYRLNDKPNKDVAYFLAYHLDLDPSMILKIKDELKYLKGVLRYKILSMPSKQAYHLFADLQKKFQTMLEGWGKQRFGGKVSFFGNAENTHYMTWKAVPMLNKYLSRFGNIKPRDFTGNSVTQQKKLRKVIINARELGLLEFVK